MKNPFKKIKKRFKRNKAKKVKRLDITITFNNGDDNLRRAIMQMGFPSAVGRPAAKCDNMAYPDEQFEHEVESEQDVEVYQEAEQDVEIDNEAEDEIIAAVGAENNVE